MLYNGHIVPFLLHLNEYDKLMILLVSYLRIRDFLFFWHKGTIYTKWNGVKISLLQ